MMFLACVSVKGRLRRHMCSTTGQVLRYCHDPAAVPLWPSTRGIPSAADIPECENCGAPRQFEFQACAILLCRLADERLHGHAQCAEAALQMYETSTLQVLPQLLNHLDIEADAPDAPDWGAIAVYTCSANCGLAQPGYLEEFAWVQSS
jgi:pre-rRNA-processing protein TSR4